MDGRVPDGAGLVLDRQRDGCAGWISSPGDSKLALSLGALLDPVADKVLLSGSFLTLGLRQVIPFWLMAIVLGRDLLILGFAIVALARKLRRDFPPSVWGKASTAAQIAYVLFAVGHEAAITPLIVATILSWIAATLTLWSGIDYFIQMSRRVS